MKEIIHITYQCEICGTTYEDPESALRCESQGRGTPIPTLPTGVRYKRVVQPSYYGLLTLTNRHSHGWQGFFMDRHYGNYWFDITDPSNWKAQP